VPSYPRTKIPSPTNLIAFKCLMIRLSGLEASSRATGKSAFNIRYMSPFERKGLPVFLS
jgi:hypothetical protein